MFRQAVVLCAAVSVAFGAVAIAKLEDKPLEYQNLEGCYIGKLDTVIPFGESRPSNDSCMSYRCFQDHVTYEGCGVAVAKLPCKVVQYLEKPHPGCCPQIECPEDQTKDEENSEVKTEGSESTSEVKWLIN